MSRRATKRFLFARGLITAPAKTTVEGALSVATNVIARRPKKLESRRGHKYEVVAPGNFQRIFTFAGSVFGHLITSVLGYNLAGTWTAIAGTYTFITPGAVAISQITGRVRDVLANGSLYVLSNEGITRISSLSATPTPAGGPRGLSFDRAAPAAVLVTAGGWLTDQYQAAYRGVLAIQDVLGARHFGEPTARTIISNATWTSGWVTTEAKNVVLRMLLPSGLTTAHFFQVYRSKMVPVGTQPDDDLQLVYQDYITAKNVTDGYVEFTDIFSEAIPKGAFIHTSPNNAHKFGDIDGENGPPPVAMDACVFRDRLFLFNVMGYETFQLTVIGVGGTNGIQNADVINIANSVFTATTGAPGAGQYKLVTTASALQNNEQTALNLVELINKTSACAVAASYVSGPDDIPGKILLRSKVANESSQRAVTVAAGSKRTCFDPVLTSAPANFTLARVATLVTATTVSGNHSFRLGETVAVGGAINASFVITGVTATTFTYTDGGHSYPQASTQISLSVSLDNPTVYFRFDTEPNAWAYSKPKEMGAFPIRNRGYAGALNVVIGRAVAIQNSIVVWTYTGGLGRISGDDPESFRYEVLDPTAHLIAPESVVVIGEKAYGWTTRGVIEVSDSGMKIISGDIAPTLDLILANRTISTCRTAAFGVGLAGDGVYELWVPAVAGDYTCSTAYVFVLATERWSQKSVPYLMTCGTYRKEDDKGWWGDAIDILAVHGIAYSEKKLLTIADYIDETIANPSVPVVVNTLITKTVTFQPFAGNNPSALKNWQEVIALFETACPATLTVSAVNELAAGNTNEVITPADTSPAVRWWPALDASGARITISISSSLQSEFALLGIEIDWEEFGAEVTR